MASSSQAHRAIASIVGIALLVCLVTAGAAMLGSGKDFWFVAIAGYLFAVPFAISAWHGDLFRAEGAPRSAIDWLWFFVISAALSGVFIIIDIAVVHPGFSLIFTFGAVAMALIALPSAARAWLLDRLSLVEQEVDDA